MLAAFTRTISRCWSRTMEAKRGEPPTPWLTEAQPIPTETLPCAERRLVVLGTPAPTLSTPMRLTAALTAPSCGKMWREVQTTGRCGSGGSSATAKTETTLLVRGWLMAAIPRSIPVSLTEKQNGLEPEFPTISSWTPRPPTSTPAPQLRTPTDARPAILQAGLRLMETG